MRVPHTLLKNLGMLTGLILLVGIGTPASALVIPLNNDNCTGGCRPRRSHRDWDSDANGHGGRR